MSISAAVAPLSRSRPGLAVEPRTVFRPKQPIVSAISAPSRWREISMCIGLSPGQQYGIIRMRPCQNDRMKGLPAFQKASGAARLTVSQREVAWTSRI